MRQKLGRCIPLFVLAGLMAVTSACKKSEAEAGSSKGGPGAKRQMQFPVEVQRVESEDVEYSVTSVGSLEAFEQVAVTSRVTGAVEQVRFREGEWVNRGAVLVEIEPQRYRLVVQAAEAAVARERAALAEARAGLERRESASAKNPGLIRGEEIETWRTRAQTAQAEVSQALTTLQQAKLNLRDAFVRAPVSGTIQTRTVQTGQYVQPGVVLATLVRRDPLLLRFEVPEQDSARVRPGMRARFTVGESQIAFGAKITHVAESASASSRMVPVTAHVTDPNKGSLRPGAFAKVVIPIGGSTSAPVIPQTAIRPSERGFLAFIVEGNVAREKILTLGMRTAEGKVEVKNGIAAGDMLVIRGTEALRDGVEVKVAGVAGSPAESGKVRELK